MSQRLAYVLRQPFPKGPASVCVGGGVVCSAAPLGLFAAEQTRGLDLERSLYVNMCVLCSPNSPFSRFKKEPCRSLIMAQRQLLGRRCNSGDAVGLFVLPKAQPEPVQ